MLQDRIFTLETVTYIHCKEFEGTEHPGSLEFKSIQPVEFSHSLKENVDNLSSHVFNTLVMTLILIRSWLKSRFSRPNTPEIAEDSVQEIFRFAGYAQRLF